MTSTKAQKIRVGAFVAISAALVAVVIVVFGGMRFWKHRSEYTIVFDESVMGLETGAQVYRNGIKVGRVNNIAIDKHDLGKVVVTIAIEESAQIHTDTEAMLQYAGITGMKVIDLRGGTLAAPILPEGSSIRRGETLLDKVERRAMSLVDQSEKIMNRAYTLTDNLAQITDPKRFDGIDEIMMRTRATVGNLEKASGQINAMIAENRVALRETLGSVRGAADSAHTIITEQVTGLASKASDILSDLHVLVRGSEGQLRSAVFDLRQASRNFKEMSREVRQRPSRLLFSSPPSERKLP